MVLLPDTSEKVENEISVAQLNNNDSNALPLSETLKLQLNNPIIYLNDNEFKKIDRRFLNNRIFEVCSIGVNLAAGFTYGVGACGGKFVFPDKGVFSRVITPFFAFFYTFLLGYCLFLETRNVIFNMHWQIKNAWRETQHNIAVGSPILLHSLLTVGLTAVIAFESTGVYRALWQDDANKTKEHNTVYYNILTQPNMGFLNSPVFLATCVAFLGLNLLVSNKTALMLQTFFGKSLNVFFAAMNPAARNESFQKWFIDFYSYFVMKSIYQTQTKEILQTTRLYVNTQFSELIKREIEAKINSENVSNEACSPLLLEAQEALLEESDPLLHKYISLTDQYQKNQGLSPDEILSLIKLSYEIYAQTKSDRQTLTSLNQFHGPWLSLYIIMFLSIFYTWWSLLRNEFIENNPMWVILGSVAVVVCFSNWSASSITKTLYAFRHPELVQPTGSYIYHYDEKRKIRRNYVLPLAIGALLSVGTILRLFLSEMVANFQPAWLKWVLTAVTVIASWGFYAAAVDLVVMQVMTDLDIDDFIHGNNLKSYGRHALANALLDVEEKILENGNTEDLGSLLHFLEKSYSIEKNAENMKNDATHVIHVYQREIATDAIIRKVAEFPAVRDARLLILASTIKAALQWTIFASCDGSFSANAITVFYLASATIDYFIGTLARTLNVRDSSRKSNNSWAFTCMSQGVTQGAFISLAPTAASVVIDVIFLRWFCHILATNSYNFPALHAGPVSENFIYGASSVVNIFTAFWPSISHMIVEPQESDILPSHQSI